MADYTEHREYIAALNVVRNRAAEAGIWIGDDRPLAAMYRHLHVEVIAPLRAALARAEETAAEARDAHAKAFQQWKGADVEIAAMLPVVEAAKAWFDDMASVAEHNLSPCERALKAAVRALAADAPAAPIPGEYVDVQWGVRHAQGHSIARSEAEAREWVAEATGPVTVIRRTVTTGPWRDADAPAAVVCGPGISEDPAAQEADAPAASEPECDGLCVDSADIGVPGYGIAYPHPGCPAHGEGARCECGQPDRCNSYTHDPSWRPAASEPTCGSCDGDRWVDDENWQPEDYELKRGRVIGSGRIPCGLCNHGGWNVPDAPAASEPDGGQP